MKPLSDFDARTLRVVLTDIDGTLTENGQLPAESYERLWRLSRAGLHVVPVTGRPAGWCELIARLWPVHGVVGENGAFYFRLENGKMRRGFVRSKAERTAGRQRLRQIRQEVLATVPGSGIASDQFSRLFDLAVDFCEDVKPLKASDIDKIVSVFKRHGAVAKVSNIHVNGWFGDYDKVSTCKKYLHKFFGYSENEMVERCCFIGDSPNDEPMFEFFPYSFAVANIREFESRLKHHPGFVASQNEASGFCQIADQILKSAEASR